jgi:hypothetical protein
MYLRYILILFLFFTLSNSLAQIAGTYVYSAGVDAGTRTLVFKGSNFSDKSTGHVSGKYGEGSYLLKNNQLYLNYHTLKDSDSSVYKIDNRNDPSNVTRINIHAFEGKMPVNGAGVAMRDKNFDILFSVNTVVNGVADLTIRKQSDIHYLTIDFIGLNSVTIPFDKLRNKANDIFVDFKPQRILVETKRTDVYRVLKLFPEKLILSDSTGTELVFKKVR